MGTLCRTPPDPMNHANICIFLGVYTCGLCRDDMCRDSTHNASRTSCCWRCCAMYELHIHRTPIYGDSIYRDSVYRHQSAAVVAAEGRAAGGAVLHRDSIVGDSQLYL